MLPLNSKHLPLSSASTSRSHIPSLIAAHKSILHIALTTTNPSITALFRAAESLCLGAAIRASSPLRTGRPRLSAQFRWQSSPGKKYARPSEGKPKEHSQFNARRALHEARKEPLGPHRFGWRRLIDIGIILVLHNPLDCPRAACVRGNPISSSLLTSSSTGPLGFGTSGGGGVGVFCGGAVTGREAGFG
eukprot:scaffold626_cov409-Prasinococcus_capsulatus_cf.AAC.3